MCRNGAGGRQCARVGLPEAMAALGLGSGAGSLWSDGSKSRKYGGGGGREDEAAAKPVEKEEPSRAVIGTVPCPMSEERFRKSNEEETLRVYTRRKPTSEERWRLEKANEESNLMAYTRRNCNMNNKFQ